MGVVADLWWHGWFAIVVLLGGFALLITDRTRPELVMLGMLTMFMATGIVTSEEALEGFSNSGLVTVAVLFVVAAGVSATGGLDYTVGQLLGRPKTVTVALLRMMFPVAVLSCFVNDTPIVVLMLPLIISWANKARLPATVLLIPLSFTALLGGTVTLVGTSTNLVVAGQHRKRYLEPSSPSYDPNAKPIGLFDLTPYGLPVCLWGLMYMALFAPILLPGDKQRQPVADCELQDFMVGLEVTESSPVVGKPVDSAGLRGLEALFLVAVRRGTEVIHAVGPEFVIAEGDVLFFSGLLERVEELSTRYCLRPFTHDLEDYTHSSDSTPTKQAGRSGRSSLDSQGNGEDSSEATPLMRSNSVPRVLSPCARNAHRTAISHGPPDLVKVMVRGSASIVGHTIKSVGFRAKFGAAIVSVNRHGQNIAGKLGEVELAAGDILVMNVRPHFWDLGALVHSNFRTLERKEEQGSMKREFMLPMEVKGRLLAGKTIESAGLRGLPDSFLICLERTAMMMHAVDPTEVLLEGDILWFACRADSVQSLRRIPGLTPHTDQLDKLSASPLDRRLVQAVIATHSSLAGKSIRQMRFRTRFDAAVVAVHRQGERIHAKIGDIVLRAGDVLLLDTGPHFLKDNQNGSAFSLISEIADSSPPRFDKFLFAVASAIAAFVVSATGLMDLVTAMMLAAGIMLTTGCLSSYQAMAAVKWEVVLMIGAAFGISEALQNSGVAAALAGVLVDCGKSLGGSFFIVAAVYVATVLLSQLVANNAAAALMFPIAASVAERENMSVATMSYVLMLAASATYLSPFSYQTNLMVFAAGRYKTMDFVKFGGPMQVWQATVTIVVLLMGDWWPFTWLITACCCVAIIGLLLLKPCLNRTWQRITARSRRQAGEVDDLL